jgi:hypothetical protein
MEIIMSTDYATEKKILFADLFDGRLKKYGIEEVRKLEGPCEFHYLTDGTNCLLVSRMADGMLGSISRHGGNNPRQILDAIREAFDTVIFSEYQPQFWGFNTREERDAAQDALHKKDHDKYCRELYKFLKGEDNDTRPGTNGMIKAELIKKVVDQHPELMVPANKDRIFALMDSEFFSEMGHPNGAMKRWH